MGYDIHFKVKVEGIDKYITVGDCEANTTWNVREIIRKSTGLEWNNEENNGLCKDVMLHITEGLTELTYRPNEYKQYEASNGYGTVEGCRRFFLQILKDWEDFCEDTNTKDLADVATFWID